MSWLAMAAFGKRVVGAVWGWLTHASFWQFVAIALGIFAAVQHFQLVDARHDRDKLQRQIEKMADAARDTKAKLDAANTKIATEIRERHDEESRRIAADARDLGLSGPGRAGIACPPAASGGQGGAAAGQDVAGPALPPGDRAAVQWGWLVVRAEEHDALLNEAHAWRDWYARLLETWPKNDEASPK